MGNKYKIFLDFFKIFKKPYKRKNLSYKGFEVTFECESNDWTATLYDMKNGIGCGTYCKTSSYNECLIDVIDVIDEIRTGRTD